MRRPPRRPPERPSAEGPVAGRRERELARPAPAVRREVLRRQANLAERVASFLRDQPRRDRVGLAAGALLMAAAGAALVYDAQIPDPAVETIELAAAQPLVQEVREGLPGAPGRYRVYPDSVQRDQRGVYQFDWQDASTSPATRRQASASLLRLAGGDEDVLEVPAQGDPILYLRSDTEVGVVAETADSVSGGGGGGSVGGGRTFVRVGSWYPLQGDFSRSPSYRYPSTATVSLGDRIDGSVASASPPSPQSRVLQVPPRADAVSGQARGTGGGTAATSRIGGTGGRTVLAPARSSGFTSGLGSRVSGLG